MKITLQRAVEPHIRRGQIREAMLRRLPSVPIAAPHDETMVLACYGPSLARTYGDLRSGEFFTVSGAHDFLLSRGLVPSAHIESDPRPHKAELITPDPRVLYLVASCCHRLVFEKLLAAGCTTLIWHTNGTPEEDSVVKAFDSGAFFVVGGSTVGLEALALGSVLGFRSFDVYGMDCAFADDGEQHAGAHPNPEAIVVRARIAEIPGREWRTSPQMISQVREFAMLRNSTPSSRYVIRGDGLLAATLAAREIAAARGVSARKYRVKPRSEPRLEVVQ